MPDARELMLRLLLEADVATWPTGLSMEEAVDLAFRWKVLPAINEKLKRKPVELSDDVRSRLRRSSKETFLRSASVIQRGIDALAILENSGISCAAFKGLAALASHGGGRTLQDVDVLIKESDLERAVHLLEMHGYQRSTLGDLGAYVQFVRNSPGFSGNEALALTAPAGSEVDLHWRVGPRRLARFETQHLLSRAQVNKVAGKLVPVVCPIDAVLLTVHHSVRNNFVPDQMIRDLLDVQAWLMSFSAADLAELCAVAGESSLLSPLIAMVRIISRFDSGITLNERMHVFASHATTDVEIAAQHLVELFLVQLERGPMNRDLVYLVNLSSLRRIVSGGISNWPSYRARMRELEIKNEGSPVQLAGRMRRLLRSVTTMTRRDWSHIRTLANIKE